MVLGRGVAGVLVVVVLLSGCMGGDGDTDRSGPAGDGEPDSPGDDPHSGPDNGSRVLEMPVLEEGDAWSYGVEGIWPTVSELTVVVARQDTSGTLFAVSDVEELDDGVAWDMPMIGFTDERLRPLRDEAYGGGLHGARLLDFPLEPGKSWDYWDTELTAQPAVVSVLGEDVPGYRIEGEDGSRRVLVEYAAQVGYVTFYEEVSMGSGETQWRFELTGTDQGRDWVWFERAHEVVTSGLVDDSEEPVPLAPPETLEVVEQDDRVYVWALGSQGSRGIVVPPVGGEPWTFEGGGVPNIQTAKFEPHPGSWSFTGSWGDPDGWVYMQGHALRFEGPGWEDA